MLCLPAKANKISAGKSREVPCRAMRVKAVIPAGNDDKSSRKGAATSCLVQDSLSQNQSSQQLGKVCLIRLLKAC